MNKDLVLLRFASFVHKSANNNTALTVNTSFSNQVSVEFGIHADLCVVHAAYLLGVEQHKSMSITTCFTICILHRVSESL